MRGWGGMVVAVVLAAALIALSGMVDRADRARRGAAAREELLYYPSGVWVRQATLGYETAAADLAWLRGIQYYGEHRLNDQRYDMIGHVMNIVTDLDPRFTQPYVFGAFVMSQELGQPQRGLELMEKGMRANPEDWKLAFETGFLHYVGTHDHAAAARYFARASALPGHPEYAERFAAFAAQRAGDRDMAILLWKRVEATGNKYMQEVARRELRRLGDGAEG